MPTFFSGNPNRQSILVNGELGGRLIYESSVENLRVVPPTLSSF